jgi:hypothetical protein
MKVTLGQLRKMIKEEVAAATSKGSPEKIDMGKLGERRREDDEDRMDESQRGNDENSQHDNDTEPGDPMLKRLKETTLRDLRLADKILRRR